jgi:hypothetical protein
VETLPDWMEIQTKNGPLWFTTHFYTKDLNARQRHWSELLSEYNFKITYIKGTMNRVVDALSQRPRIFSVIPLQMNLRENILTIQCDDDCIKRLRNLSDKTPC